MYHLFVSNLQQEELGNAHILHTYWPNSPVFLVHLSYKCSLMHPYVQYLFRKMVFPCGQGSFYFIIGSFTLILDQEFLKTWKRGLCHRVGIAVVKSYSMDYERVLH